MTALPLVFDAPKRALPPRHLADLDPAERRAAVAELGLPGSAPTSWPGTTSAGSPPTSPR